MERVTLLNRFRGYPRGYPQGVNRSRVSFGTTTLAKTPATKPVDGTPENQCVDEIYQALKDGLSGSKSAENLQRLHALSGERRMLRSPQARNFRGADGNTLLGLLIQLPGQIIYPPAEQRRARAAFNRQFLATVQNFITAGHRIDVQNLRNETVFHFLSRWPIGARDSWSDPWKVAHLQLPTFHRLFNALRQKSGDVAARRFVDSYAMASQGHDHPLTTAIHYGNAPLVQALRAVGVRPGYIDCFWNPVAYAQKCYPAPVPEGHPRAIRDALLTPSRGDAPRVEHMPDEPQYPFANRLLGTISYLAGYHPNNPTPKQFDTEILQGLRALRDLSQNQAMLADPSVRQVRLQTDPYNEAGYTPFELLIKMGQTMPYPAARLKELRGKVNRLYLETVAGFLQAGHPVTSQNPETGETLLHLLAQWRIGPSSFTKTPDPDKIAQLQLPLAQKLVQAAVEQGVDVAQWVNQPSLNYKDPRREPSTRQKPYWTALSEAVFGQNLPMTVYLKQLGASPGVDADKHPHSPLAVLGCCRDAGSSGFKQAVTHVFLSAKPPRPADFWSRRHARRHAAQSGAIETQQETLLDSTG